MYCIYTILTIDRLNGGLFYCLNLLKKYHNVFYLVQSNFFVRITYEKTLMYFKKYNYVLSMTFRATACLRSSAAQPASLRSSLRQLSQLPATARCGLKLNPQLTARARGTKNFSIKWELFAPVIFMSENSLPKFFRTYYVRKTV